ncbi:L-ascorbate 6-phosphate lactonase [Halogeometricum rufum]|uniref:L-ascorbate 6-phosphate lactonase n=1 Tax=Halogeometricum rufum TaxID=553469 RepID=A0A1I6IFI2_9EURY|nr:MBL fold metallo-hydrolase [Halogeometricum rufum]SFR65456.1 L-ascorbate 6-phosphate lactonase [Halogeometricum rufum]
MTPTIHSDWGDWLLRRVRNATTDGVAVWFLGGNGFLLKDRTGTTIYIDPYLGTGDLHVPSRPRTIRMIPVPFDPNDVSSLDALLISHEHSDHRHEASQAPMLERTAAQLYAPEESIRLIETERWQDSWDISPSQLNTVSEADKVTVGEFTINVHEARDPNCVDPVSYVIEHESGTFFHGGDSLPCEGFTKIGETYDIDLGVLAFGTRGRIQFPEEDKPRTVQWYNDQDQVVTAANMLQLDRLLPSHYDLWRGLCGDPESIRAHSRSFSYPRKLELAQIGDRIHL